MLQKSKKKQLMTSRQYFVKTLIFIFFFFAFSQIVYKVLTARDEMTSENFIKLSAIAFLIAVIFGTMNYFVRIDFFDRKLKNEE